MSRSSVFLARWLLAPVAIGLLPAAAAAQPSHPAPASAPADAPAASPPPSATPPTVDPSDVPSPEAAPHPATDSAAPASLDGTAEAPPVAASADEVTWAERDRNINESNTLTGGSGLLRTQHAETGSPGQFRLGFVGEWFSAGFLCTSQFPCPNPNGGAAITSDTVNHIGGTLTLGVSIADLGPGILEGYASTDAYANSDAANRPALLQVLGDTDLGLKWVAPAGDVLRLGLFTELLFVNGLGSVGLDDGGTGARFGGIATVDLRGLSTPVPLRFSANIAYSLDNTGELIADVETARQAPITRIERFGLGITRVDHFDFLFGAEALLADERVRPFIETRFSVANNRQGYECREGNPSHDNCLLNDTVIPAVLTLGGRFFPWKKGFSVLAALDIGLGGTNDFIEELQPVPPWTLFLGAGWAVDTVDRPAVVTKVAEAAPPQRTVRVVGFVHEKDKNDPIANAIVSYPEHPELSPLATGADGRFGDDVPPNSYTFAIRAEGYKDGMCVGNARLSNANDVPAFAAGPSEPAPPGAPSDGAAAAPPRSHAGHAEVDIDCPLEALPRVGAVAGNVRDADTSQALAGLQVVVTDALHKELRMVTSPTGAFRFEGVSPGAAQLTVVADGYLAIVAPTDVKARQDSTVDLLLRPRPKRPAVQVTAKEITIRDQIQFALDSAVILPQSFGTLTEVADTLIRRPEIKRVEIQGHTDNSGTAEHNLQLSEERAEAVSAWLVQHGVPADRLVSHGYGQDKPLVPNVTPGNRAQNRRVQFIIVDRDAVSAPAGTSPTERPRNPLPGF